MVLTVIKVYSLPVCPRCETLKTFLTNNNIPFESVDMESAEGITELRVAGCFAMEAPVLVNETSGVFMESAEMFPNGTLDELVVKHMVIGT